MSPGGKHLKALKNAKEMYGLMGWVKQRSPPHNLSSQAIDKSPTHYPCDSARTFRVILFSIHNDEWKSFQCHHQTALRSYALSGYLVKEILLNLPDHKLPKSYIIMEDVDDCLIPAEVGFLPHAHAQSTNDILLSIKSTNDEDTYEHVHTILEILDLFHFPVVTYDAIMLRVFPITLNGQALRWKDRLPAGSITTWDLLKKEFI
ncbi:hypothetical protein Tco_0446135 [Tanacetum coccineum]